MKYQNVSDTIDCSNKKKKSKIIIMIIVISETLLPNLKEKEKNRKKLWSWYKLIKGLPNIEQKNNNFSTINIIYSTT